MEDSLKTSLDDLISLLLQNQAPFGDEEFIAAAHHYRHSTPGGAMARQQVNLAACLYLQVKKERISERRIKEVGGWGQRNAILDDMASFTRGHRPVTSSSTSKSMLSLGAPPANILQIAVSQGLEAAQKMLELSIRGEFNERIDGIQTLADQRVLTAERNVLAATELKEAAQAQSRLLEQKFDQAITGRTELTNRAAAAEARAGELATQVAALTTALSEANGRAQAAEAEVDTLRAKVEALLSKAEADRKESMLAIDRARHGNDELLGVQQAEISRLAGLLEKSQAAGEAHAQAARRAEAEVAGTRAELTAASDRIGELLAQQDILAQQVVASNARLVTLDAVNVALTGVAGAIEELKGKAVATPADVATVLQQLGATDKTIQALATDLAAKYKMPR